ncbi:MAG: rhodanese-like domain-containing protein [Flavobacteriaceae bacterium]|nr:rhodanese-like domain-containing protein [Flavobacteriaceae bacterium]
MKYTIFIFLLISAQVFSQKSLKKLLKEYNTESVPYMDVNELNEKINVTLLDTREVKEYEISHLKNAIRVGYDYFDIEKTVANLADKKSIIVVYCSVGIRSEDIAEKLQKAGYKNVYNLYGGIFEWKNNGFKVYDKDNQETEKVHTFNKEWSKWLNKGEKIYE